MFRYRIIKSILLVMLICVGSTSCVKYRLWRADRNYKRGAYAKALDDYRYVSSRISREKQPPLHTKMAYAYMLIGNARQAEVSYERSVPRGTKMPDSIYLALAKCQLSNEKYAQALTNFNHYLEHTHDENVVYLRNYCQQMTDTLSPKLTRYLVTNAKEFNSAKDDFAPMFMSEDYTSIAFTSSRQEAKGRKTNIITGDKSTDIFTITQGRNGKWEKVVPLKGKVNNKHDNGVCTFSADYQTMYFTECSTSARSIGCKLYTAIYDVDLKEWLEVTEIVIADSSLNNYAHPALSPDGTELYFAADCDSCDNYGGMDIYKIQRMTDNSEQDTWTTPQNMGAEINTAGDEMYPYMHANGTLYFSSNGHQGFGGLDIFKATQQEDRTWKVENMGLPINSSSDDFGIVFEADREAGMFASRRKGGRGGDDIYRFVLPEMKYSFAGIVRFKDNKKPMADVTINMIANNGDQAQYISDADGKFSFNLKAEVDYLLQVRKQGYFNEKLRFSTIGMDDEVTTLREEFYMTAMDKVIELQDIYYEFGKWDLLPESEASLNELVTILNDNPSISIVITAHTDMRGTEEVNQTISQRRAQSVVDYLIANGIREDRLEAEGMGKASPRVVSAAIAKEYPFLKEGDILSEEFTLEYIKSSSQQEIVDRLNRRTEFVVVSTQ